MRCSWYRAYWVVQCTSGIFVSSTMHVSDVAMFREPPASPYDHGLVGLEGDRWGQGWRPEVFRLFFAAFQFRSQENDNWRDLQAQKAKLTQERRSARWSSDVAEHRTMFAPTPSTRPCRVPWVVPVGASNGGTEQSAMLGHQTNTAHASLMSCGRVSSSTPAWYLNMGRPVEPLGPNVPFDQHVPNRGSFSACPSWRDNHDASEPLLEVAWFAQRSLRFLTSASVGVKMLYPDTPWDCHIYLH